VKVIAGETNALIAAVAALESALEIDEFATTEEHMQYCAGTLRGLMDDVRSHADVLEAEVADEYWPLPKYREMLFIK
jgi:glutamine synthetase